MTIVKRREGGRRVVVTGLGLATPLGPAVAENWRKLLSGVSGISRPSLPGSEKALVHAVGEVSGENIERIAAEYGDIADPEGERRTLFALWAAGAAVNDAGLDEFKGDRDRFGTAMAAGLGIDCLEDVDGWMDGGGRFDHSKFCAQFERVRKESIMRNSSSRPSALIAARFGFRGPNLTITTACASATQAIGIAFRNVRRGDVDVMLAGGADSMVNPVGLVFFPLLGSSAAPSGDPGKACRPFDRKRTGLVMGEGAGAVILEEESHAVRRRARIYAEVAGYASSMDAHNIGAPRPDGLGAAQAMQNALKDAGLRPDEIDYINAHGTSTKLNDIAETIAIKKVFGESADDLCISSSKSMIGHLMAASGAPEFVYTALSVYGDEIHPTINLETRDPKLDLDYTPNRMRRKIVRAALSNSFGFGGQNACIAIKKYIERPGYFQI